MMRKKGTEFLANIVGYFFLVLIVIMFAVIAKQIQNNYSENVAKEMSIDYLKTDFMLFFRENVVYKDEVISLSELIIESEFDDDKLSFIRDFITEKFNDKFEGGWSFDITYPSKHKEYGYRHVQKVVSSMDFPSKNSMEEYRYLSSYDINFEIIKTLPGYNGNIEIKFKS